MYELYECVVKHKKGYTNHYVYARTPREAQQIIYSRRIAEKWLDVVSRIKIYNIGQHNGNIVNESEISVENINFKG